MRFIQFSLCLALALGLLTGCLTTANVGVPMGKNSGPGGGGGNNFNVRAGRSYYDNVVNVMFMSSCNSCHNEPRFNGDGPLTIYNYDAALAFLRSGSSPDSNELMNWVQNLNGNHPGGDRCNGNPNLSPCAEIKQWWIQEVADGNGPTALTPFGLVNEVTPDGTFSGWCVDTDFPEEATTVEFYINNPRGSGGTRIGAVLANRALLGVPYSGNHGFSFPVPQANRDRQLHNVYAYCLDLRGNGDGILTRRPKTFQLYATSQAGMNYFNNTVVPAIQNRCNNCHMSTDPIRNYEYAFYYLLGNRTPARGGTATDNLFINKPLNVTPHSGNNVCGNINTAPCSNLVTWWNMEFGTP